MNAHLHGINIAYTDQGAGVPVVFVHGFPLNRAMWSPQVEALAAQCRTITVDLRGHGESDAPLWRYTIEQFADDLNGLLDHLSLPQVVLVGLSMGGYVLFAFYRKYPQRVQALVLTDTRAQADTEEVRNGRFAMAQTAYTQGLEPVADMMLPKLLCAQTRESQTGLVEQVRKMVLQMPLSGLVGDLMAMAERPDSVSLLKNITDPTLVVVGEHDQATPPSDARVMAEGIQGAQLRIIPGAAHLPNLEQPEAYNQALASFLATLSE